MRLASLDQDHWCLVSGESRHAQSPDTFEIPSLFSRESLKRGDGAKLVFEIEYDDEAGQIKTSTERMWVVVSEKVGLFFIGRLANSPVSIDADENFYLRQDAEIPFLPEHVIDIDTPDQSFLDLLFSEPPRDSWPR